MKKIDLEAVEMTETTMVSIVVLSICGLFFIHRLTDGLYKGKLKMTIGKILEISSGGKI
jgi:hypothetical protein